MRRFVGHASTRRVAAAALIALAAAAAVVIDSNRTSAGGAVDRHAVRLTAPVPRRSSRAALAVVVPHDPFKTHAMRRFLASRSGNITAAVYDVPAHTTFLYHPDDPEQTASIVKVDILATLLSQAQARHEPLAASDVAVATGMIEESDNDDAQYLFEQEGGPPAIEALNRRLDMTQTAPNWAWGLTETTPRDQLRLLRHIALPNHVLHSAYRQTELYLMEHVISDDYWGITSGPVHGVTVAVKNGWLPVADGWQINSIGMVRGDHRFYLIAVMTNGNPGEGDGIYTIEGIAQLVWDDLREHLAPVGPTGPSGVSGISGTSGTTGTSDTTGQTGANSSTGAL